MQYPLWLSTAKAERQRCSRRLVDGSSPVVVMFLSQVRSHYLKITVSDKSFSDDSFVRDVTYALGSSRELYYWAAFM